MLFRCSVAPRFYFDLHWCTPSHPKGTNEKKMESNESGCWKERAEEWKTRTHTHTQQNKAKKLKTNHCVPCLNKIYKVFFFSVLLLALPFVVVVWRKSMSGAYNLFSTNQRATKDGRTVNLHRNTQHCSAFNTNAIFFSLFSSPLFLFISQNISLQPWTNSTLLYMLLLYKHSHRFGNKNHSFASLLCSLLLLFFRSLWVCVYSSSSSWVSYSFDSSIFQPQAIGVLTLNFLEEMKMRFYILCFYVINVHRAHLPMKKKSKMKFNQCSENEREWSNEK